MEESFINEFLVSLSGKVPDQYLPGIKQLLGVHISKYDISLKETSLDIYRGHVPEYYSAYFVTKKIEGLSMKSLELYKMYLDDFFMGVNKPIETITANDIRVYLYKVQQARQLSNRTLDSRRSAIHAFMEWCVDEDYLPKNPCRAIKPIKYERRMREPLTHMELEYLRDACRTEREKAMIEVFYSSGCRVTELVRLNVSDVNFTTGEIALFGKGDKHRVSYISAKAKLHLQKYLDSRGDVAADAPLFAGDRAPHNRLAKTGVEKVVAEIGQRSKVGRSVYPHLIRHTTATDCLTNGMRITDIQKLLGHSSVNTTMIYAKVSQADIQHEHSKCIA